MGFTKLDEVILQSSVMAEPSDIFKVWIVLLAAARADHIARISPVFLASICHLPIEVVTGALNRLQEPDPYSRSKNDEGRRVREVDGGFLIINRPKYTERTVSDYERDRKRKQRTKKLSRTVPDSNGTTSVSVSVSESGFKEGVQGEIEKEFAEFWETYPKKVAKQDALKAYRALRRKTSMADIAGALNGYNSIIRQKGTDLQYVMHPATFLRNEKWRDFVGQDKPPL